MRPELPISCSKSPAIYYFTGTLSSIAKHFSYKLKDKMTMGVGGGNCSFTFL